jgi:diamine N-acetyltransferase
MRFDGAMSLVLRSAAPADVALVHRLIGELADYEQLAHEMVATPADVARALFVPPARVFCEIAELDGEPVGFALWFYSFSTFQGRFGIYLEDLYVRPEVRQTGVGSALLKRLAEKCVAEGLGRLSWNVLDWNKPAIEFYQGLGAQLTVDWTGCRLEGEALAALGTPDLDPAG